MHLNRAGVQIFDKETTGGQFALDKPLLHINVLELTAVLLGINTYTLTLNKNPVLIHIYLFLVIKKAP